MHPPAYTEKAEMPRFTNQNQTIRGDSLVIEHPPMRSRLARLYFSSGDELNHIIDNILRRKKYDQCVGIEHLWTGRLSSEIGVGL